MTAFDNILRLKRRCDHFIGEQGGAVWNVPSEYLALTAQPVGMGIAAHNYSAAMSLTDSRLEQLFWIDAVAASFNRYIDTHRIADDENAKRCLRWWRRIQRLFFDVEKLA